MPGKIVISLALIGYKPTYPISLKDTSEYWDNDRALRALWRRLLIIWGKWQCIG
ncbi:hypothetical protein XNA1_4830015 [Xenorhabdus nematophila str. Anatoliense]|nr:hypothetical protein XNA1_4830015 [Xenorhabdus nematophila str. Anatoliense]